MNEDDFLISMFIDDELSLDEKIDFVEQVHRRSEFRDEAVSLLSQEKDLRSDVRDERKVLVPEPARTRSFFMPLGFGMAAAAIAATVIVISSLLFWQLSMDGHTSGQIPSVPYRFVIYEPDAARVEIAGSFTGWKRIPMDRSSKGGYWELTLRLQPGEHSFTYILDGTRKMADPTMPANEPDDFGGVNSILYTGGNA
jgi:hypothetical protein